MKNGHGPILETWKIEHGIEIVVEKVWNLQERESRRKDRILIVNKHNWSNTNKGLEVFGDRLIKSVCYKPLGCALGVPEPNNLIKGALSMG